MLAARPHEDVDPTPNPALKVGQRVRTNSSYSCASRTSRIAEVRLTHEGQTIYILQDGGWFFANELTPAK